MTALPVETGDALYIKLGRAGEWERECIRTGTLRIGYREIEHASCERRDWTAVERQAALISKDLASAKRHLQQIRRFYESEENVLWITFYADRLWWCFAKHQVHLCDDKSKTRDTVSGWRGDNLLGQPLLKSQLSGSLLAVQGFQGTICKISRRDYLLHKINGTLPERVVRAQEALVELSMSLVPIIQALHPKDLEILVDLIFRDSGWSRTGVIGESERDIDLDLMSPLTGERIAVQVKARAGTAEYRVYREKFADMRAFARFYFIVAHPLDDLSELPPADSDPQIVFWGPCQLAEHAARNGLAGWLLDRAA